MFAQSMSPRCLQLLRIHVLTRMKLRELIAWELDEENFQLVAVRGHCAQQRRQNQILSRLQPFYADGCIFVYAKSSKRTSKE